MYIGLWELHRYSELTYFKNGGNPLNGQRLQSDSVSSYTYDANVNMITKTGSTFTWDPENRLTGVTATYNYDYLGRRSTKTVSGATTTYIYEGQNLIGERGSSIADFVFGSGIDEPLAMSRSGLLLLQH